MIEPYQKEFINFLLANDALRFGSFTLKSGRSSPYFINTGHFYTGEALNKLASFYSSTITSNNLDNATIIFGPAYKGIPLCVSIASDLARRGHNEISYLFDRKEAKLHGEYSDNLNPQNLLLGKIPTAKDRILIVDDVMTTGGTKYEAVNLIKTLGDISISGLVISVDRQEIDQNGDYPIQVFQEKTGIPVISIISIETIIDYLADQQQFSEHLEAVQRYRQQWGVTNKK